MTISELAKLNKANGGHFFNRDTMAHFGDTMKSFTIKNHPDNRKLVIVTRKTDGRKWNFDKATGRIDSSVEYQEKLDGTRALVTA